MDDNHHNAPTKRNIEAAFKYMVDCSHAGDVVFVHYSGHGSRVRDLDGDEDDGFDETLVPVDFKSAGQIVDGKLAYDLWCLSSTQLFSQLENRRHPQDSRATHASWCNLYGIDGLLSLWNCA